MPDVSGDQPAQFIVATEDARTLPAIELLTGRGFVTGKSGSGKSNSVSVITEELLGAGYNLLIIDTEGEYFGLKEQYEVLHVGRGDRCDVELDRERAGKIAEITLRHNVPVILNVSDILDQDEAKAIISDVVERLFVLEGDYKKPFLLIVEEMQEYLPQSGGKDDLSKLLLRVAKRGRKRGLGLCGISQRPSAVDKDFITQCDWMVWHRLTWQNDVEVVRKILGSEVADDISDLDDGQAYLLTDWDDDVSQVQFRRKKTFDAGATPGLEDYERPSLKRIGEDLVRELEGDEAIDTADLDLRADDPGGETGHPKELDPEMGTVADGSDPEAGSSGGAAADALFADELQLLVDDDDAELDTLSREELRERLEQERRRADILAGEVRELKEIINAVDSARTGHDGGRARSASEPDASTTPSIIDREPRREGLTGTLVELTLLTTFLGYRLVDVSSSLLRRATRGIRTVDRGRRREVRSYPVTGRRSPRERRRRAVIGFVVLVALVVSGVLVGWYLI